MNLVTCVRYSLSEREFNSQSTDVDCTRLPVFVSASIQQVVKNKIYLKSSNPDIRWDLNFTNHIHFQSLEPADRGSETQHQVTEN